MMPLEASGYFYQQGSTLNTAADLGFKKRMKLFLKEGSVTAYSGEAAMLCGPIYHDLISCEGATILLLLSTISMSIQIWLSAQRFVTMLKSKNIVVLFVAGVPPGISITLNLYRNKPEIAIDVFDGSTPDYVFNIKNALLHVPIGKLSSEVFTKYELSLQKKAATLRIRRWMVKVQPITKGKVH